MYTEQLQSLGLAQNEARIYEALLREGESSVGQIASSAKVNRRNVYDSLARLVEKGLVFEIIQHKENRYQAVEPNKLSEVLQEKQKTLNSILPFLEEIYHGTPHEDEVYIYKGMEGWRNYMRDIIRVGKDCYALGAKGSLNNERLKGYFTNFKEELENKDIVFYNLYDHEVKGTSHEGHLSRKSDDYRFLPAKFSSPSVFTILEDRVFCFSNITLGSFNEDVSFSVIVNKEIAQSCRTWFKFMWEASGPTKKASQ